MAPNLPNIFILLDIELVESDFHDMIGWSEKCVQHTINVVLVAVNQIKSKIRLMFSYLNKAPKGDVLTRLAVSDAKCKTIS